MYNQAVSSQHWEELQQIYCASFNRDGNSFEKYLGLPKHFSDSFAVMEQTVDLFAPGICRILSCLADNTSV